MKNKIVSNAHWILLFVLTIFLFVYFLFYAKVQLGGDIVEYYGITETVLNHRGFNLTKSDQTQLEKVLHPAYFQDPGYYIKGKDGNRYPVHFFFYSLLVIPFRMFLHLFHLPEIKALSLTNVIIFSFSAFIIMKWLIKRPIHKFFFLTLYCISPIMSFFVWPGPDVFMISLLTIGVFAFFQKKYAVAAIITALASWHSQPLIITSAGFCLFYAVSETQFKMIKGKVKLAFQTDFLVPCILAGIICLVPYAYNYAVFGVFTPWTILQDGWTKLNGFGVQNISLKKLFEQFFDLDMGLFWYYPLVFFWACIAIAHSILKKKWQTAFTVFLLIATAFFYQTNPGWHYGTSGYGPTRHVLFAVPFLMYFIVTFLERKTFSFILFFILIFSQLYVLSLNKFLEPDLTDTLRHSLYTLFVLNNIPNIYNPTPAIFVDRTNQTNFTYPTSAIYKYKGQCKKAFVLKTDIQMLTNQCKTIPEKFKPALENEFLRVASYSRTVITSEATFWPDPESCASYFTPTSEKPFICMKTIQEVMKHTGITDVSRITTVATFPYPGIWKMTAGAPMAITVPPGYIINHQSIDGVYVTY